MNQEFKYAVIIGRFQPFHNAHLAVVEKGLEVAEEVIVVIGSVGGAPSIRNPFTYEERRQMIRGAITNPRIKIVGVRDYFYSDNAWLSDVQAKTDRFISEGDSVAMLGSYKDGSSYYLNLFPQWEFMPVKTEHIGGTEIRDKLFDLEPVLTDWEAKPTNAPTPAVLHGWFADKVPPFTLEHLESWVRTPLYAQLCKEAGFLRKYKEAWSAAPFPPVFVTADAIVTCSGHVLLVQRKMNPGKGLYAVPGGFIKQTETIKAAALRELREETGIRLDKQILESAIVDSHVFDHPDRSMRGRTITHGFHFKLKDGKLPEVKGGDDAAKAVWVPYWDVMKMEDQFFEDHLHIVQFFVGAQGER